MVFVGALLLCGCDEQHPKDLAILQHHPECDDLLNGMQTEAKRHDDGFRVDSVYSVFYSAQRKSCMGAEVIMDDELSVDTAKIVDLQDRRTVWSKVYKESHGPKRRSTWTSRSKPYSKPSAPTATVGCLEIL